MAAIVFSSRPPMGGSVEGVTPQNTSTSHHRRVSLERPNTALQSLAATAQQGNIIPDAQGSVTDILNKLLADLHAAIYTGKDLTDDEARTLAVRIINDDTGFSNTFICSITDGHNSKNLSKIRQKLKSRMKEVDRAGNHPAVYRRLSEMGIHNLPSQPSEI